jgi:hypothetical protein
MTCGGGHGNRTVHRGCALALAFVAIPGSPQPSFANPQQLAQLLDAGFKCSRERDASRDSRPLSDVKYQYRFSTDNTSLQITTRYLGVGYDGTSKRYHSVEHSQVISARFADIEVFRSQDPLRDTTIYISCDTDAPCIRNSIVSDTSSLEGPRKAVAPARPAEEGGTQFSGYAATYYLCDAETAEYVRLALRAMIAEAKRK